MYKIKQIIHWNWNPAIQAFILWSRLESLRCYLNCMLFSYYVIVGMLFHAGLCIFLPICHTTPGYPTGQKYS